MWEHALTRRATRTTGTPIMRLTMTVRPHNHYLQDSDILWRRSELCPPASHTCSMTTSLSKTQHHSLGVIQDQFLAIDPGGGTGQT